MTIYSAGKGRRKAVNKFRIGDGLWMLTLIAIFSIVVLFLMVNEYINVDHH